MPQHDLDIADGSGLTVLADLNSALVALGTTMKGPSAPPSPRAGMVWVEDDNPSSTVWTVRMYDGADWISMGTIDTTNNLFRVTNSPPTPQGSAGLGQVAFLVATLGSALVLPAGGTWEWFVININSTGNIIGSNAGTSAGGTTLAAAVAGQGWYGRGWRYA